MNNPFLYIIPLLFSFKTMGMNLDNFCKQAQTERNLSKMALKYNGRYKIRVKSAQEKFPSYKFKYYRGCYHDIPWMDQVYNSLCKDGQANDNISLANIDNVVLPKVLAFAFAGAGDFNAVEAKNAINPVNIRGFEGNDFTGHALSLPLMSRVFRNRDKSVQLSYYSSSGFHQNQSYNSALACIQQTHNYLEAMEQITGKAPSLKWAFIGYSNGGAHAIDLQNELAKMDIGADLVFTVDPVVQTVFFPFHTIKDEIGMRNARTKVFINYYQRNDFFSLPPLMLRGKPVPGADFNYNVTENEHLAPSGFKNHNLIVGLEMIARRAKCEFNKLIDKDCTEEDFENKEDFENEDI